MFGINWEKFRGLEYRQKIQDKKGFCDEPSDENYRHNNFELLAVEIMKQKTQAKWEHTKWAGDFNHDAYAVVSLYRDNNKKKWWLEAKYSYSKDTKQITRYRLDATIVSKLLEEKSHEYEGGPSTVSKIFFFTNTVIPWKVKSDIKNALKSMKKSCAAIFIEREDIEYWLFCHKEVHDRYFTEPLLSDFENDDLIYIGKNIEILPSYYKFLNYHYIARDKIKLVRDNTYVVTMNVYNNTTRSIEITAPKGIKLVSLPQKTKSSNFIEFKIKIIDRPAAPLIFTINGKKTEPVDFDYEYYEHIDIASHKSISCAVKNFIAFKDDRACSTLLILGKNATGKTALMHRIMEENATNYFFISFEYEYYTNIIYLCKYIFHLFLPYIDYEDIDDDFISELKKNCGFGFELLADIKAFVAFINKNKYNASAIEKEITRITFVFPQNIPYDSNILFIDNIQRLGHVDGLFFKKISGSLEHSSFLVKMIAFGNTFFQDNELYDTVNRLKLPLPECGNGELVCEITINDVIRHINKIFNAKVRINFKQSIFTDLFEINGFISYLRKYDIRIDDSGSFFLEFSRYKNQGEATKAIKDYINTSLNNCDEQAKALAEEIYYMPDTVPYLEDDDEYERKTAKETLLGMNLIKCSLTGMLEPYHETYRNIYMRYYTSLKKHDISSKLGEQEGMIFDFNFSNSHEKKITAAKILCKLPHKYPSTVMYALEPVFSRADDSYKKMIRTFGVELFFELFHAYAVSCAYNGTNVTGSSQHEKIVQLALQYDQNYKVRTIALISESELLNSKFDGLRIEEAKSHYKKFLKSYNLLKFSLQDDDEWKMRLLHVRAIDVYIKCTEEYPDAEKEFLSLRKQYVKQVRNGFHHFLDCTARYAQLLYASDIEKAYKYTEQSVRLMNSPKVSTDEKQLKEINFQLEYIKMIRDEDNSLLQNIIDRYYDFGNGFRVKQRKVRCALISACLKFEDYKNAEYLLECEIQTISPRRMRLDMFFKQALALYYLKAEKNFSKSVEMLKKALKLVKYIPSYGRIIEHNIRLLQRIKSVPQRINFAVTKELEPDVYYIDPRADR